MSRLYSPAIIFPINKRFHKSMGDYFMRTLRQLDIRFWQLVVMCSLAVFFTGVINGFIIGSFAYLGENVSLFYKYAVEPMIWLLPKFDQGCNISKYIIDAKLIGTAFFAVTIAGLAVKSAILLVAGFIIFARREIAKVIV